MATLDGFNPYPIGLSASQSVQGIKNGYALPETLKDYSCVINSIDPPTVTTIYNQSSFWYNEANSKVYRASKNDSENIVIWFEL